jgi:hypothetical protein
MCPDGLESDWMVVDIIGECAAALTSVAFPLRFLFVGVAGHSAFFPPFPVFLSFPMCVSLTYPDLVFF